MSLHALPGRLGTRSLRQKGQWALDVLLGWSPVVVLGLLLLVTTWLVRTAPPPLTNAPVKTPQHVANYDLRQFTLNTYNLQGQLQSSVSGLSALHFEDTLVTMVEQPQMLMYAKDGRVTSASAKKALSNEDGSEVQLIGQAQVYRASTTAQPQALTVKSEFLHFFANTDSMQTDLPVVVTRGANSFRADQLRADNLEQVLNMRGRVRVVLHPENAQP